MKLLDGVTATAALSPCGTYRYTLTRSWGDGDRVLWVMLNPSTADADVDDWTIRRCQAYARAWGHDGITVANLFALRSTDPKALYRHPDPEGPENDGVLAALAQADDVGLVVAAWGDHGTYRNRGLRVARLFEDLERPLHALGLTKSRHPRHPRGMADDAALQVWTP